MVVKERASSQSISILITSIWRNSRQRHRPSVEMWAICQWVSTNCPKQHLGRTGNYHMIEHGEIMHIFRFIQINRRSVLGCSTVPEVPKCGVHKLRSLFFLWDSDWMIRFFSVKHPNRRGWVPDVFFLANNELFQSWMHIFMMHNIPTTHSRETSGRVSRCGLHAS